MVDENSRRTIAKLRLTLPHQHQSDDNQAINAGRKAKHPALLHIDPKGEGGPQTAFARTYAVEGKRCYREQARLRQADARRVSCEMRDPSNEELHKPRHAHKEPHRQRVAHPTRLFEV